MLRRFLLWNLGLTLVLAPVPVLVTHYLVPHSTPEKPQEHLLINQLADQSESVTPQDPVQHKVVVYKDKTGVFRLIVVTFTPHDLSTQSASGALPAEQPYDLEAIILQQAQTYRLDPNLIKAVIMAESNFRVHALSAKGAQGLMQLMPATAEALAVSNPFHPAQNIAGGVKYLRYLLDYFHGDLTLTLAAYNAGPTTVEKWQGVPPFPETAEYIHRVKKFYRLFTSGSFSS
jgi:soluble lytic murein transglycosylase